MEAASKRVNVCLERIFGWVPARVALGVLSFFGFINLYMVRINLSIAIVAMTGRSGGDYRPPVCLNYSANTLNTGNGSDSLNNSSLIAHEEEGELAWSKTTQGFVLGSFFYGYAVTQVIGGRAAEIHGTRWVFGGCILAGGLASLLAPTAARLHYGVLIALRIVQGAFQGVSWPSMHALISSWIPPVERSRFVGYVYFAATLSTAVTLPLCGLIIDRHGWDEVFYVTGCLSLLWCLAWFGLMYNTPAKHPRISQKELNYIESSILNQHHPGRNPVRRTNKTLEEELPPPPPPRVVPWRAILTSRPVWAIFISAIGNGWCISFFFGFLPTYMKNILGFSIKENGVISALPFLSRYLGCVTWSSLGDFCISRGYLSLLNSRRIGSIISMWVPAVLLVCLAYNGCGWQSAVGLMCMALFCNGAISTASIVNHTDLTPNFAGTVFGLDNTIGSIVAFITPSVIGYIIEGEQTLDKWRKVFWTCVPLYFFSEIFYLVLMSVSVQPWNSTTTTQRSPEPVDLTPGTPGQESVTLLPDQEAGRDVIETKPLEKIS